LKEAVKVSNGCLRKWVIWGGEWDKVEKEGFMNGHRKELKRTNLGIGQESLKREKVAVKRRVSLLKDQRGKRQKRLTSE